MSKHASSPTARLLQSSRLFSLPRPLPLQPEFTTGPFRNSETATTSHPTHQAITTPASSYSRGDWGLKRAIPSKRKKSNPELPTIRVRANDTWEHITDFTSAGDHVQTLRKWQQMEVPFIQPVARNTVNSRDRRPISVFEERTDNTDPEAKLDDRPTVAGGVAAELNRPQVQRWKYKGPWLGGMKDGEFELYLKQIVHSGDPGKSKGALNNKRWEAFMREKWVAEKKQAILQEARDSENPIGEEEVARLLASASTSSSQEEINAFTKRLRDDHAKDGLSSQLTAFICEFFDLPFVYAPRQTGGRLTPSQLLAASLSTDSGPPTTHPSGGLSHLRTNAIMPNHPLYGPQRDRAPVEARVVRPRTNQGQVVEYAAKIGVGGVVAEDDISATGRNPDPRSVRGEDRMAHSLDQTLEHGNKMWVLPQTAYMDHRSRIRLAVSRAGQEAVAVKMGDEGKIREIGEAKSGVRASVGAVATWPESMRGGRSAGKRTAAPPRRYSGVTGFDAELGAGTGGGNSTQRVV